MNLQLIHELEQQNPWLLNPLMPIIETKNYRERLQLPILMQSEWDDLWILLIGPRRAGKTTLGKYLSQELIRACFYQVAQASRVQESALSWDDSGKL